MASHIYPRAVYEASHLLQKQEIAELRAEIERLRAGVAEVASALEAQAAVSLLSKIVASDLRALIVATPKEDDRG
jgi:hypothetical protein